MGEQKCALPCARSGAGVCMPWGCILVLWLCARLLGAVVGMLWEGICVPWECIGALRGCISSGCSGGGFV